MNGIIINGKVYEEVNGMCNEDCDMWCHQEVCNTFAEYCESNNCHFRYSQSLTDKLNGKMKKQDPWKCEHCFASGVPPFPTCRKHFNNNIDADNTCILWRRKKSCPDFTSKLNDK